MGIGYWSTYRYIWQGCRSKYIRGVNTKITLVCFLFVFCLFYVCFMFSLFFSVFLFSFWKKNKKPYKYYICVLTCLFYFVFFCFLGQEFFPKKHGPALNQTDGCNVSGVSDRKWRRLPHSDCSGGHSSGRWPSTTHRPHWRGPHVSTDHEGAREV